MSIEAFILKKELGIFCFKKLFIQKLIKKLRHKINPNFVKCLPIAMTSSNGSGPTQPFGK